MRTFLDTKFKQLREFFAKMSKKDKIKLGILSAAVIILAIVTVSLLSRKTYETLYTAQDEAEAGRIYSALQEMGQPVKIEGTRVLVLEGRSDELRVVLANEGVTGSGEPDLSILESAAGFGITDSQAKKLYEAQAAVYIRGQLLASNKIQNARVTVNLGEYSPFAISTGVRDATAAVMLILRGNATLTQQEAQVIADLVKNNVPGVKYENITITDSNLNYYKIGEEAEDIGAELSTRIALKNLLQQQIQMQIEQLLMPIFGLSSIQVTPSVTLNFDKKVTEEVEFYPPVAGELDGIVRSSSELYENQRNRVAAEGIPGTDSNAMGTVEYPYVTMEDGDEYRKALIEKNYEINETRNIIEYEQGTVERLSISVLIDSEVVLDDYTREVTNLVSKGLGVATENIAVERLPFLDQGLDYQQIIADQEAYEAQLRRREMLQMVLMWAVILLLGLAFISLIKAIVKSAKEPEPEELLLAEGGIDYYVDDELGEEEPFDDIELQTKSTALEQIERFIDKDPVAVAQLLRNWLTDES